MTGAGSQTVGQVKALAVAAVPPRLDVSGSSIRRPPNVDGRSPRKTQLFLQLLSKF
jgi:hypothetical protein